MKKWKNENMKKWKKWKKMKKLKNEKMEKMEKMEKWKNDKKWKNWKKKCTARDDTSSSSAAALRDGGSPHSCPQLWGSRQCLDSYFFGLENLLTWTFDAMLLSMCCQSAMIESPVQPRPEFSADPMNIPGSIVVPNWWRRPLSFVEIRWRHIASPSGTSGTPHGVPNRFSCSDFLLWFATGLSRMFKRTVNPKLAFPFVDERIDHSGGCQ